MTLTIQSQLPVIIGLTILIVVGLKLINNQINKFDPLAKPTVLIMICMTIVELIDNFVSDIVSPKYTEKLGPYIGSIAIYILLANYVGLFGFESPTGNFSVTLSLALITWILIQVTDIKFAGVKGYVHSFFEPIFLFFVPNVFGTIAPLVSMSLRLFGNLVSGTIIMTLVYGLGNIISGVFFKLFTDSFVFNFVGPIIAAPLHLYFDIWSGAIQMFIFIMLTMVFTGNKIPEDQKK